MRGRSIVVHTATAQIESADGYVDLKAMFRHVCRMSLVIVTRRCGQGVVRNHAEPADTLLDIG